MHPGAAIRVWLSMVALVVGLAGCAASEPPPPPPPPLAFVAADGVYAAYPGEQFDINLAFEHTRLEPFSREDIVAVTLEPATETVQVESFGVFALNQQGNLRARKALSLVVSARQPGEHTFTQATVTTRSRSYAAPLGALRVVVREGAASGALVVFQSKGVFQGVEPMRFTVVNPTNETLTLRGVIPEHPRLRFTAADILVDAGAGEQAFPAEGLPLPPQARVAIVINWEVDLPNDSPLSIEWRPLLALDRQGSEQFVGMANIVFRNQRVNAPLS